MLRFLTAGESHGPALSAIIEGAPAGLVLTAEQINRDLARRQQGYGRGGRMRIETDKVEILSGVRFGKTLGTPISLLIRNKDWENWTERMSVEPLAEGKEPPKPVVIPRPGHADLAGLQKYHLDDIRNVLERASARETAARVAVGAVAKRILEEAGIRIASHVVQIGEVSSKRKDVPFTEMAENADQSPVRCLDGEAEAGMLAIIDRAKEAGDTVGGVFEVVAVGVPPGLGAHVHWDRKLDGLLAQAVMSIHAIKGVEIGMGFGTASTLGSRVHDEIVYEGGYRRLTNNAGGLEGGITNGEPVVVRAAMKPIPTLLERLRSVNIITREPAPAHAERSDVCAVPAAAIVGEAMVAIALANALLEKFGSDAMSELIGNLTSYLKSVQ